MYLEFDKEADTLWLALNSAVAEVEQAGLKISNITFDNGDTLHFVDTVIKGL